MENLEFIIDALVNNEISKEVAISLIEMEYECVAVVGKPEPRAFAQHYYPKGIFLTSEFKSHVYHIDMRQLSDENLIKLCQGNVIY